VTRKGSANPNTWFLAG